MTTIDIPAGGPQDRPAPVSLIKQSVADHVPTADEVPTWVESLKARIVASFADGGAVREHLARAQATTWSWLMAEQVTDEELVAAILLARQQQHETREKSLRDELSRVARQLVEHKLGEARRDAETRSATGHHVEGHEHSRHRDTATDASLRRRQQELEVLLAEHGRAAERLTLAPTASEVGRARWGKRTSRAAALVGSVIGGGIVLPVESSPAWLLASLPAAAVALWRVGLLPDGDDQVPGEEQAEAVFAEQAPLAPQSPADKIAAAVHAVEAAPPASVPVNPFADEVSMAPEERAAAAEQAEAQIVGARELLDHLVEAKVIGAGKEREQSRVLELRSDGPGWTAVIELPRGKTAEQAVTNLTAIASTLKVKASRLELTKDTSEEGHEGRFRIWCADVDNPYAGAPVPSELIKADRWDFWRDGVPLGADARQVRRILNLLWSSMMIGGLQRYGKSFMARLIAAAAALDPHVRIVLICGKVSADWAPLKKVAHAYVAGSTPDKVVEAYDTVTGLINHLQGLGAKMEALSETDPEACPEGKLTRALAEDPEYGLTLLIVDELQNLLAAAETVKNEEVSRKNYASLLVDQFGMYNRLTPSAGGMAVGVTQRPGADSVPTVLRDSYVCRASFRVQGASTAEMVLGKPAVDAGAAPHMLLEHHKGVAVIELGEDAGHFTIKTDMITIPEFHQICERGQKLRIEAGTLTGYAARHVEAERAKAAAARQVASARSAAAGLLRDCLAILDELGVDRMRSEPLAAALIATGRYEGMRVSQLTDLLREAGAGTTERLGQWDGMANPRGYLRQQLQDALARSAA